MATVTSSKRQLTHTSNTYESNGDVTIGGNLNINGTTTTIDTANLLVEDKNIIIGDVSSPTDSTADGGGITLKGASDKTINWVNSTDSWTSNQNFSAPSLTLTGLATSSETTALLINAGNQVVKRALGSNAFNSTSFAPLASPALTGNPTAPTQGSAENSTKIATTAYVKSQGYATAGDENIIDGATSIWNADGDGDVFTYNDSNPTHNSKATGAVIYIRGDGSNDGGLVRAGIFTSDHVSTANGYYVGTLLGTTNSTTTQVISSSGAWTGSVIPAAKLSTATTQSSSENSTKIATTAYVKNQGYVTSNTQLSNETVQDIVGGMLTGNTESGITVTYDDVANEIDFTVASQTDQNFTNADHTKLNNIADNADVTPSWVPSTNPNYLTSFTETNTFLGDGGSLTTHPGTSRLIYTGALGSSVSGLFSASDNSNSVITLNRHVGNYDSQLGFSSNGSIYYRKFSGTAINTSLAWQEVWHSGSDGSGSGLDADKLDGEEGSHYLDYNNFTNTPVDQDTTYSAGNGISLSSTTFSVAAGGGLTQTSTGLSHSDTSTQASVNNSNGNVIQDVTLDTYGHVTALNTANLDGRYYTEGEIDTIESDLYTAIGLKANLASPALTGIPTAPTPSLSDDNTNIATTEYVKGQNYLTSSSTQSKYLRSDTADTASGVISFTGGHGAINITNSSILSSATSNWTGNPGGAGKIQYHSNRWYIVSDSSSNRIVQFRRNSSDVSYIANNGDFIGNVTGALTGNASTATSAIKLAGFSNQTEYDLIRAGNFNGLYMKARWDSSTSNRYWDMGYVDGNGTFSSGLKVINGGDITYKGNEMWHAGNDGTGSGLDADKLDGLELHTSRNNEANKVVRTDGNGYLNAGWINTTSGNNGTTTISRIYASQDDYIRYYTPANFGAQIGSHISYNDLTNKPSIPSLSGYATEAHVSSEISSLIGGAPGALDTLNELAAAINDDASYAGTITTALGTKAPLASPTFTGSPTAPTQGSAENSTKIATTAYVKSQGYITTDTNTTYSAGTHLALSGTTFNLNLGVADKVVNIGHNSTSNEGEIILDTSVAGSPQISFTEHGDASWAIGVDDGDNSFKIHGSPNSTIPTINSLATPLFEIDTSGASYLQGSRVFADNYHPNADILTTARTISLGSDLSGSASFNGGSNITINAQIAANAVGTSEIATNAVTSAKIAADAVGASELNVSGNGTTAQFLRSDGDGTFTWATPTDTNTDTNTFRTVTAGGNTLGSSEALDFVAGSNVTITESGGNVTIASTDTNTTYSVGDGGLTQKNFTSTLKTKLDGIAASANNYSLPAASSSTRGGVKIGYSENGKYYPVELDSSEKMFVNVPWTDTNTDTNTTYSAGTGLSLSGTTFSITDTISSAASNNTIVKRHSSGYIFANYFNTTPNTVSSGITQICVETGNDGYIRHGTAAAVRSFINVANGANNYSLPAGSSSTRGGFKIGFSESGKYYPVETSSEKMFVHVPWTDTNTDTNTTYSAGRGLDLSGTQFLLETDLRDSISHIGYDSNDYVQWSNNSYFRSVVNGSERFRVNTSGIDVTGSATANFFRTDTGNTDYSSLTRNSANNAVLYVQSANTNTNQPIAYFSYGSTTAAAGNKVLVVRKDNTYFTNTKVGVGTTSPSTALHVDGTITQTIYYPSSFPSASPAGQRAFAYSFYPLATSHGSVVSTNGSYVIPVYSDGSSWRAG